MSSFLANATPATYYSYGQQSDFPNADLNSTASNYAIRSFHDLSSSSSSPTTNHHLAASSSENASAHYYSLNDTNPTNHTSSSLSNTPPSSQSTIMNSSNNGNSSNSLDLHLQHTQMNGQLTNSGTPSNQYQTTAQLTPPPSVSTDGSHQSPVLTYPSYRDYTELSNSNNSINSTPTTTSSSQNMNNSTPTTTASNGASQQQSSNQSPKSDGLNSMTAGGGNPLHYSENNNAMDLDSGMSPSASASNTYTPSIHNPYHLAAAHQSNAPSSQFNLHHHSHSQSTNAFGHHQANPHQFANSQADGLINQHQHHLLPASYHQLHHSHLNSHNQIQTQPQHPHLHPQLNALNVAVHVHNFNPNPSIIPNSGGSQANSSYLPENPHLSATTPVSPAVNSAFTNGSNGNSFINSSGLLTPAQPFLPNNAGSNCGGGQSNGLPSTNGKPNGGSSSSNPNNPNSRNDSPLGPYSNLTSNAIGQSIACDSAAASASLLLDAHNTNGSGSSTPNPAAATNGFHSLMYHLNPLSSNSPSPTLQAQQSQLHLAQHHHHHLHQNQFVQHPSHHHQLHPHQQLPPQAAQQLIAGGHPVGSLNHHLQGAGPPGAGNQFAPQHAYSQLNNATPNHLSQPMHPMHFKMQAANSNHQMVNSFNSSAGIANQSGNGNSRNSSASSDSNKQVYKWMQVKRSQPKTGKRQSIYLPCLLSQSSTKISSDDVRLGVVVCRPTNLPSGCISFRQKSFRLPIAVFTSRAMFLRERMNNLASFDAHRSGHQRFAAY